MQKTIREYIEFKLTYSSGPFETFEKLLLSSGSCYESHDFKTTPMSLHMCYKNALELALKHNFLYCEGIAALSDLVIPLDHAWCIDSEGEVVDPTWSNPRLSMKDNLKFSGVGLVFDPKKVMKLCLSTGSYGIIQQHYNHKNAALTQKFLNDYHIQN